MRIIYGRADTPYKTLDDIRNGAEQPRCGATALGTVGHYFPRLIEEVAGVKFNIVTGYPGAAEIDLAMQKGEVQCRAGSLEGYFGSEPTRTLVEEWFHPDIGARQSQTRSATSRCAHRQRDLG